MKTYRKTTIAMAVAQLAAFHTAQAWAEEAGQAATPAAVTVVTVTGQRASLQSAQTIKRNADEIVDSIVADDIGKMPDRSVTEVLQRVPGVTMDRVQPGDPTRFFAEGTGVAIRGLSYVRSELNGRDSFSANGGRALSFEDVPPELMAGVDVYKNPSAEQIEGGISGLINLRTAMPFDYKGFKGAISAQESWSDLKRGKPAPSGSALLSNRWKTRFGDVGLLFNLADSKADSRSDSMAVEPYYPRTDILNGKTAWVPRGIQFSRSDFDRTRKGQYVAAQWRPNNDITTGLTYFRSVYDMTWHDHFVDVNNNPYETVYVNPTFDANNIMTSGIFTDPKNNTNVTIAGTGRVAVTNSTTSDLSWNMLWRLTSDWALRADAQSTRSSSWRFDSSLGTDSQQTSLGFDLRGDVPQLNFTAADAATVGSDAAHYWSFGMEHLDRSRATQKSLRLDLQHDFDSPVLRDIRFGVRLTDRDANTENTNPSYHWDYITPMWATGWGIARPAYLTNPLYKKAGDSTLFNFNNFYGGKATIPSLSMPSDSVVNDYPNSYTRLFGYRMDLCKEQVAAQGWGSCTAWLPAAYGDGNFAGQNRQAEKTQAAFAQLRFGFDTSAGELDGNVGMRYVKTQATAFGYTALTPGTLDFPAGSKVVGGPVPQFKAMANAQNFEHKYHNFLPSLNLRLKTSDTLQFRLAVAKAMSRPNFSQLQGYTSLSSRVDSFLDQTTNTVTVRNVANTGDAAGNPMLKPVTSTQVDLTAEWYPAAGSSLTLALFHKDLKDIIVKQSSGFVVNDTTGTPQVFTVTSPVNGAKGYAKGFELAGQTYLDKTPLAAHLPDWMGSFGVQASFTFVDSKRELYNPVSSMYCTGDGSATNFNLNLNGCDSDARSFGNLPLEGLSRQTVNFAVMYDRGPISSRLAYNRRSRSLQYVNSYAANGTNGTDTNPNSPNFGKQNLVFGLPLWAEAYGQLDGSLFYKVTENMTLGLEARNLTNAKYMQTMQQHIGDMKRGWYASGRSYSVQARYTF